MYNINQHKLKYFVRKLYYITSVLRSLIKGCGKIKCPCCNYEGSFDSIGNPPRYGGLCPSCGSYERHRLLALSNKKHNFFQGKDVLHFAPETVVEKLVKSKATNYITADIVESRANRVLNIEKIDEIDNTWDLIICSHVLEHVDDEKALSELYRILRNNGILIVMVPIVEGWGLTYENEDIHTGSAREEHFGQSDHVRYYGSDIRDRILSHGFVITEDTAYGEDVVKYGLLRGDKVFICKKKHKIRYE